MTSAHWVALGTSVGVLGILGCSASTASHGQATGSIDCHGESRPQIDCASEVAFQGSATDGSLSVAKLASASGKHETTALRRIDEQTSRYVLMQSQLCRDYNACAVDRDKYLSESRDIRARLTALPSLRSAVEGAQSETDRARAIDALYQTIVPAEARAEEVGLRLDVDAELPNGEHARVMPSSILPTGTRIVFRIEASATAYVYLFQQSADGSLAVLFPNAAIGTKNPLNAGVLAQIPPGIQRFRLNDKDLGTERVYVAASRHELVELSEALTRVDAGKVATLDGDAALGDMVKLGAPSTKKVCRRALELDDSGQADSGCTRSRGLELDGSAPSARPASFETRTEPGDDVIVRVFSFQHVSGQEFARQGNKVGGKRSRGILIEDD